MPRARIRTANFSTARVRGVAAAAVVVSASGSASAQWLVGIGHLPGGTYSTATGVSGDGSVVVGHGDTPQGDRPIRWTLEGGPVNIGVPVVGFPTLTLAYAHSVSSDGLVIAGVADTLQVRFPFRWREASSFEVLSPLLGANTVLSAVTSGNGSVIAGGAYDLIGLKAYRSLSNGALQSLGVLPGGTHSFATGIGANGSVIVGWSESGNGVKAFRWTPAGGMVDVSNSTFPGAGTVAYATAVSEDGLTILLTREAATGQRYAFRWKPIFGLQFLPNVLRAGGGAFFESPTATSADGRVIVGSSSPRTDNGPGGAVIAFALAGADVFDHSYYLQEYLSRMGLDLTEWHLTAATGVSGDGLTIVGYGTRNGLEEGWVARLQPAGCATDYNRDTVVNPDDLGDYITDYFTVPRVAGPGGYAVPCFNQSVLNSGFNPSGYRATFPFDPGQPCQLPNPDNLGDFITAYFAPC